MNLNFDILKEDEGVDVFDVGVGLVDVVRGSLHRRCFKRGRGRK